MFKSKLLMSSCLGILLVAGIAQNSYADDVTSQNSKSDEIVIVTATRVAKPLDKLAAPVSLITAKDIANQQAESYVDLLQRLPGVDFYGGPRVQGEMPNIRGATGRQVVILVDGARQNASPSLSSPLYLEANFLSRTEVLKGASSSLYGQGGLGGTLLFTTQSASELLKGDRNFGANLKAIYQSANEKQQAIAQAYGTVGNFDIFGGVSASNWGAVTQGGGKKLTPGDGNATAALGKVIWHINDALNLQLSHSYYDTEDFQPNNPQASSDFPYMQNNWATNNQTILKLSNNKDFKFSLYNTRLKTGADARLTLASSSVDTKTIGFTGENTWGLNFLGMDHKITIGGDGYKDELASLSGGLPNGVTPDGEQQSLGAFINDEITLLPWLKLIPSVRYDEFKTSVKSGIAPDKTDSQTSPHITVSVSTNPDYLLYASFGQAFRAPTVYEMYQSYSVPTGFSNFRPNTSLVAETSDDIGIGFKYNKSEIGFVKNLHAGIDLFRADVDNLITSVTVGTFNNPFLGTRPILQYQNIAKARREGFEIDTNGEVLGIKVGLGYSYVRVTDRLNNANLFSPPDKLTLSLSKDFANGASLIWRSMIVDAQNYDSTLIRRRPAYDVHDIFFSYKPIEEKIRVDVGITNLFDEKYARYKQSTAYPNIYEQGRSLRIALSYEY
ncbi:TonB-dependent receptor domain-containing protein [Pseudaquidulcibacter saccharophilus]|uniref:TonB-dependent receptor domain-containing protein n=1 Tax=Pseudaquidulcibacter saccharophilus TaxID=2831900 RepID=UPI001EFF5113|nr:TonB-dependent receptor [Pseudaquidulcibacter saccharophilus]